eukprot:3934354-Rhodomonas_salina.1
MRETAPGERPAWPGGFCRGAPTCRRGPSGGGGRPGACGRRARACAAPPPRPPSPRATPNSRTCEHTQP